MMKKRSLGYCQQHARNGKRSKEFRNWLDLPRDVILLIFIKLGVVDLLFNAQRVCFLWRKLAKEPLLFRSLDFIGIRKCLEWKDGVGPKFFPNHLFFHRLAKEAVDRGCGQPLLKLAFHDFEIGSVMEYIGISRSLSSLKSLHLGRNADILDYVLADLCKQMPSLEDFHMGFSRFPILTVQEMGRSCHKLTSFHLSKDRAHLSFEEEAAAIVQNMPQLRCLTLTTSLLTKEGLRTILDGCPNLEYLDFRHCSAAEVGKSMIMKCTTRIKKLWFPPKTSWTKVAEIVQYRQWYIERSEQDG